MSTWEAGECSLQDYKEGQLFIVTPDRLAVDGVYGLVCKAVPSVSWEACRFVVKVMAKPVPQEPQHRVSIGFENLERPGSFETPQTFTFDADGFSRNFQSPTEEGYLRYYPDGTEDSFERTPAFVAPAVAFEPIPDIAPGTY